MSGEEDTDAAEITHSHEDEETHLMQEDEITRKRLMAERKERLRKKQEEAMKAKRAESAEKEKPAEAVSAPPSSNLAAESARPKPKPVIREDQVRNAVNFLNHERVKSSSLGKRIAFLEHKGLNDDEITEALKRANISSEDIKQAMDAANNNNNSAQTGSAAPANTPVATAAQGMLYKVLVTFVTLVVLH